MTELEANSIIAQAKHIDLFSPDLIGWECQTTELEPHRPDDMKFLAGVILDCNGTRGPEIPHVVAKDKTGNLSLWNLPLQTP